MGFRFRRTVRVLPGIRINLSKSGASVSVGRRGAWLTVGPKGTRATVGLPGTGLSYTTTSAQHRPLAGSQAGEEPAAPEAPQPRRSSWGAVLLFLVLLWVFWMVLSRT